MGVHGLWQILEPAGRPVDIHNLKGKVLAVDASIWLHQLVKGFRDSDGNPLPNAHLLGIFYRIARLLSFGIKPVFVFDGGVPALKQQTMAVRKNKKIEASDKAEQARQKILSNFLKQQIQMGNKIPLPLNPSRSPTKTKRLETSPTKRKQEEKYESLDDELKKFREKFALKINSDIDQANTKPQDDDSSSSEEEYRYGMDYADNFTTIESKDFDVLPLETQHEILFEMQESRKMNSWGRMEKMPQKLNEFSNYQMDRLVKRRFLQKKIQSVQQEMGQRHIHVQNLDELLKMDYNFEDDVIGSQDKGFVLVKKKSPIKSKSTAQSESSKPETNYNGEESMSELFIDDNIDKETVNNISSPMKAYSGENSNSKSVIQKNDLEQEQETNHKSIADLEEEEQLRLAIQMSLESSSERKSQLVLQDKVTPDFDKMQSITQKSEISLPVQSEQIQASCYKFLGWVGFPGAKPATQDEETTVTAKITSSNGNLTNSSSSDDDDFEDVDDSCRAVKNKILSDSKSNSPENESMTPVTTINLVDVLSSSAPVDDIFSDIFDSNNTQDLPPSSGSPAVLQVNEIKKKSIIEIDKEDEDEFVNWDSDPDLEDVIHIENSVTNPKKTVIIPKIFEKDTSSKTTHAVAGSSKDVDLSSDQLKMNNSNITKSSKEASDKSVKLISMEFMQAQERLNEEQAKLQSKKGTQERVAQSISDQISIETQELLSLFGIPYVTSPMEAESQCAFLDTACLVDGTITDDSDIWIFGGLRVYKNFYSSGNKPIEFYQQSDITRILNLDREKLVLIAMLSGGDYSDGIEGVGPVTALELLTEFPTDKITAFDSLIQMREWWDLANSSTNISLDGISKVKERLKKLKLRPGFPSQTVYEAYMNPTIDNSTDAFRWGKPDFDAIREYSMKKFGWDESKCNSMLLPVLKNFQCRNDHSKQLTLDRFVTRSELMSKPYRNKKGSKRLHSAFEKLKKITPVAELNLSSESDSDVEKSQDPQMSQNNTFQQQAIKRTKIVNESPARQVDFTFPKSFTSKPSSSSMNFHKIEAPVPQKVQSETLNNIKKQKAIKVLQNQKNKDKR